MINGWVAVAVVRMMRDVTSTPPNLWEWFAATTSVDQILQGAGVLTLAGLFATNRIITLGQHNARVADLVAFHASEKAALVAGHDKLLAEKDRAYTQLELSNTRALTEMQGSRDYYRTARLDEQTRADQATESLVEVTRVTGDRFARIMEAFSSPAETPEGG